MLEKIEKNERNLMKVESIIRALAIDSKEGMEMLVSHFIEKSVSEGDQRLVDPTTAVTDTPNTRTVDSAPHGRSHASTASWMSTVRSADRQLQPQGQTNPINQRPVVVRSSSFGRE